MKEEDGKNRRLSFSEVSLVYVRMLRILAILPFEGRDFNFLGSRILLCYFICSSITNWTMMMFYSYNIKKVTVDVVCELVFVLGLSFRYYLIIWKRSKLWALFDECRVIWYQCNDHGHRIVLEYEKKIRRLMLLLAGGFIIVILLYTSIGLSTRLPSLKVNGTERRILPYKWFIENVEDHWPGYWPTFLVQQLVVYNALLITTSCDTASPFLMMIMAGYFRYLAGQFYPDENHRHQSADQLINATKFHQRLLKFCSELEKFGRMVFLIQVLSTGYNLSLIGIKLIGSDSDKYKYAPLLATTFYQLFVCQWAPDKLFDESGKIATAAYESSISWMEHRIGRLLVIVMAKAQQPVQMTAGGIVNLSLERFGSMMTSATSFFMVLRNLYL